MIGRNALSLTGLDALDRVPSSGRAHHLLVVGLLSQRLNPVVVPAGRKVTVKGVLPWQGGDRVSLPASLRLSALALIIGRVEERDHTLLARLLSLLSTHVEEMLGCGVVLTYVGQVLCCLLVERLLGVVAASCDHSLRLLQANVELALRPTHSMLVKLLDRASRRRLLLSDACLGTLLIGAHFVHWPGAAISGVVLLARRGQL